MNSDRWPILKQGYGLLFLLLTACGSASSNSSTLTETPTEVITQPSDEAPLDCCTLADPNALLFSRTYLFGFKTGAGPISRDNPDGNLQIISSADLLTLLAAAQDEQKLGLGVVSGLVVYNGRPVQDISLKVTDANGNLLAIRMEGKKIGNNLVLSDGSICPVENVSLDNLCIKGSIYYNSPGGVPDFLNNKGTSVAGAYTIFNLPPGEVYLWASRGGRGNARIKVVENQISIGKLQVIPVAVSTVGVTGSVIEAKDESTAVPGATLSVLGTTDPGLTTVSDASGLYAFVSIGTNGNYLMKVSKPGHWDSYHSLKTTPFQATTDIQDVTKTVSSYSNGYINEIASQGGPAANPSRGIITGRVKAGDGTPQHCAKISVKDADGNDLLAAGAVLVYVDGSRSSCTDPNDKNQTSTNGLFFIYNVPVNIPAREVFVSYSTDITTGSGASTIASGGMIVPVFPGVVFVQDMTNSGTNTYQALSGSIIDETSSAAISGAGVSFLGMPPQSVTSDPTGYTVPKNPGLLIGGRPYRAKSSKSGFADTYQIFSMADNVTKRNFIISPLASTTTDFTSGRGEIHGLLIDQLTGQTAENVTLRVTDLTGNAIAGGEISTSDGLFRIPNVPPGTVNLSVISGDDSGNATLQVYPNGVTYFEFVMTKVIPSQVTVSGTVKDLAGTSVGGAQLKVLGESSLIAADGDGSFQGRLESFGRFVIKTQKDRFYDTYNFFPHSGMRNNANQPDLFAISREQFRDAAAQAGVVQSSSKGVIVGTTVQSSFEQQSCTASCSLGAGPHATVLGYFNKDNNLDIAVTNQNGTVTVLFGDESGRFGNPKIFNVGNTPSAIASGDFDGDGIADLVVANRGDNSITVLKGDKEGNFTPVTSPLLDIQTPTPNPMDGLSGHPASPLSGPVALTVGRFDSDTVPDIAVVNDSGGSGFVLVLLGNGNGTFHPIFQNNTVLQNGVGNGPKALIAGDFNQDKRIDMAISNSGSGTITVLLGSTDGTFQPLSDPNTGSPIILQAGFDPEAMALLDVNSDGRLDLAVINRSAGTLTIFIGNTSGGFDQLADANQNLVAPIPIGSNPSAISIGEFNNDGRADLAITRQGDNSVLVLFGNGDGRFTPADPITVVNGPQNILLSDQDRDGFFDLVVVGASEVVNLLGRENPVGGISVEARNLKSSRVGKVFYLDNSGHVSPNLNVTSASGRFIIFNVPPGLVFVRAVGGGAGNSIIDVTADAVSYTKFRTVPLVPSVVPINGVTYDPVGPPSAGVPVGAVHIQVLGMDVQTKSDSNLGYYSFNLDANSEYILKLCWNPPGQTCP